MTTKTRNVTPIIAYNRKKEYEYTNIDELEYQEGYCYLLKNDFIPELVKFGYTTRRPDIRAIELSNFTGVPGEWVVYKEWNVSRAYYIEQTVFKKLRSHKLKNQEFFKLSPENAVSLITKIIEEEDICYNEIRKRKLKIEIRKIESQLEKKESDQSILDSTCSCYTTYYRNHYNSRKIELRGIIRIAQITIDSCKNKFISSIFDNKYKKAVSDLESATYELENLENIIFHKYEVYLKSFVNKYGLFKLDNCYDLLEKVNSEISVLRDKLKKLEDELINISNS